MYKLCTSYIVSIVVPVLAQSNVQFGTYIYKVSPKRNYNGDYIFSTGHSRVIVEHDHFGAYILYTIYHYHYHQHCNYDQDKMTIYHHYTYQQHQHHYYYQLTIYQYSTSKCLGTKLPLKLRVYSLALGPSIRSIVWGALLGFETSGLSFQGPHRRDMQSEQQQQQQQSSSSQQWCTMLQSPLQFLFGVTLQDP